MSRAGPAWSPPPSRRTWRASSASTSRPPCSRAARRSWASGLALERMWLSSLELDFDEWITRAHPAPADAARAREMLESAARGEVPGLHAWHVGEALRFTVGLQLVRALRR